MCECLCSQPKAHIVLRIGDATVAVDAYMGCRECSPTIGIDVHVYDDLGVDQFLDGNKGTPIVPDEYGVIPSAALFVMFNVKDLAVGFDDRVPPPTSYESWDDFLSDHGLEILHEAFYRAQTRARNERRGDLPQPVEEK